MVVHVTELRFDAEARVGLHNILGSGQLGLSDIRLTRLRYELADLNLRQA
jgi:hypothetical protein